MPAAAADYLHGTVDVLILKSLCWGPAHGYAISEWLRTRTDGLLQLQDAALYQALHRLARQGVIKAEWGLSENNRRARYYTITTRGRARLASETAAFRDFAHSVLAILDLRPREA
jgi:transcriptional regulator